MALRPYTILEPSPAHVLLTPLVVDSPHSGRIYPADFGFACPLPLLRQAEDSWVDELASGAAEAGATLITAEFPRSYIDVNRAEDDLDPAVLAEPWPEPLTPSEHTLQGLGLVRRICKSGIPVYAQALPIAEVRQRLEQFYRPYHAILQQTLARRVVLFGAGYLLDLHSMPDKGGDGCQPRRPDFVLGDRDGASCDPAFTRRVRNLLQDMGYGVALNEPYKGVEIVRRYGRPREGLHALQLEINRRLYMNEMTLEKHEGFEHLRRDLGRFFRALAAELMQDVPERFAAE